MDAFEHGVKGSDSKICDRLCKIPTGDTLKCNSRSVYHYVGITFRLHIDVEHHLLALFRSAALGLRIDVLALRVLALSRLALVTSLALIFLALAQNAWVRPEKPTQPIRLIIHNYLRRSKIISLTMFWFLKHQNSKQLSMLNLFSNNHQLIKECA